VSDASYRSAPRPSRPHLPPGYGLAPATDALLPWSHATERLARARNYWVATTRPDGRPHVVPVWGLWLDDAFYFSTDPTSRKARNLTACPEVVVHLESGDDVVACEGAVERVPGAQLPAGFVNAYEAKYGFRLDVSDPAFAFYRLRPRIVYAWLEADFPRTATRWRLPGA
jgi:hypothetical protein